MKKNLVFIFLLLSLKGFGQMSQFNKLKMIVEGLSVQPVSVKRDSLLTVSIFRVCKSIPLDDLSLQQTWTDSLRKFSKISKWQQTEAYSHYINSTNYYYKGFTNLDFKEIELATEMFKEFRNEEMYDNSFAKLVGIITNFLIIKPLSDEATEKKYLNYFLDGLQLAKKQGNIENIANLHLCLVQYYIRHRNYAEAKKYAINAWQVSNSDPDEYFYYYQSGKSAEGLCLLYLGKEEEGFDLINNTKKTCKKMRTDGDGSETYILASSGVYLGNYYLEKKDYQNAIIEAKIGENALKLIKLAGYDYILNNIFYQAYKNLQKPVEALAYFEKVQAFDQEAQAKEYQSQFMEWQLKYEDEKQKNTIQALQNEKLTQTRNILLLAGLFALSIIGYVFWNNQKLKKKNSEIEQALFKGQTIERKRVAEELHDNLSAKISGIRWRLEAIEPDFKVEKHKQIYQSSVNALSEVYTDIRLISHNLLPAELESKGLVFALKNLTKELNTLEKARFSLQIPENIGRFANKIEYEVFSIILELSNNIMKHSKATEAIISLEKDNQKLTLIVADNGIGLDEDSPKKGMGMDNLKSRVLTLNGTLKIENKEGIKVGIEVPV